MMSTSRDVPRTQLALKRELKPTIGPTLNQSDPNSPSVLLQAGLLPKRHLLYATGSPRGVRRGEMFSDDPKSREKYSSKCLQPPISFGNCSSNLLRIPFDTLSKSSGMGASTVSLLVHAPSLSRVSGLVDEDDNRSVTTDADMSSSISAPKSNVDLQQVRHGCPICQLGILGKKKSTNVDLHKKHLSIGSMNVFHLANDLYEITTGFYVPALCTLHKELGWNADSLAEAINLYRVWDFSKTATHSVSLPDLYQYPKDSYVDDIPEEPTEHNVPPSPKHLNETGDQPIRTCQEKCKHWLEDLGMT